MSNEKTFKALVVEETNDGEFKKSIHERKVSDLPENDLLIEVHYSSLNYKDAMSATGNKRITRNYPHTPGIDAAGVVVSDKSGTFSAGQEVLVFGYDLGMDTAGGLGQIISIPADWAIECPKSLTLKEAMIYGTGGLTAALSVQKLEKMGAKPEDGPVAVTGATGGVGSISIAILSQLGYEVIAFSGKPEQSDYLKNLGASEVRHRDTINEIGSKPIGRELWANAIDTLGGDYLANLLKQTKAGGAVTSCGLAGGAEFSMTVMPFITRAVSLLGVDSVLIPLEDKKAIWQRVSTDMKLPDLEGYAEEITLEQTPEYLDRFISSKVVGRYVVNVRG
ncbi:MULTISPECIES: YhdH/YhfP family quinone oxidoreductase [Psychrobacter]|jgi:alcohol dehydrogenase|uniref:Alcohol dehydrogenase n=2 Tax=Psychrobacter TaxID=497 RepID=A0A1G6YBG5_9GAMM|nr:MULTISPECIES: YhdH/YhfP family quinone oxidoreductase [Psychrobacter]MDH4903655.1 oxidoreductase [Psychrobacter pocilloporae]GLR27938.1 oxidoreductase [Psychrobacter pacificensis]SDD87067.1 alcohol dehydrogenase [Psychrobacter pacificensis]HBD03155.1 oxidoreductase [Psychrobacter sp.]|tara:strand:+ start:2282 stop:3286 length:1005 start_codon:yes stop_codon:yes gene_type:complete